jgi:hypothetical protein
MAHINSNAPTSVTERDFTEFMQRGDDFFKIELLRQAKNWYTKALKLNLETEKVEYQLAECERMLAFESKVIKIVCAIAGVLLVAYFIFRG